MSTVRQPEANTLHDLVRLVYHFFGHPALGTSVIATAVACASFAVLVLVALLPRRLTSPAGYALAGALALGLVTTVLGGLVVKNFKAYQPSYSLWILPGLVILISGVSSVQRPKARRLGALALILYLATLGYAVAVLESHGTLFSHGLYARLSTLVKDSGPAKTAVVHEGEDYAVSYFPLLYGFGTDLEQYVPVASNPHQLLRLSDGNGPAHPCRLEDLNSTRLIVVRPRWLTAVDLRDELHHRRNPIPPGPVSRELRDSPGWRRMESEQFAAFTGAAIDTYERR
jgi:hypothetical protein